MILCKKGQQYFEENRMFTVGEDIICVYGIYRSWKGIIVEIRTGEDKETENPGTDIYCNLWQNFSSEQEEGISSVIVDQVIFSPDMICTLKNKEMV
ncbi:MAG TPA: hypothetical protein IAB62_12035 [Candidatus Coprocola pullicola]|nr:hypothetical protein [Candidatus Coprocola pullicola]